MNGKASKQTYLGRVIWPATYHDGVRGGKGFLTFEIIVDGVAVAQDKSKLPARIPCTYTVQSETDPVATVLCNIATKDDPEANLAGFIYKNVDLVVEGSEKLTQVQDREGNAIPKAFYKSLEYCQVTIADKQVLQAFYESIKEDSDAPAPKANHQAPTQAPVERAKAPTKAPAPAKKVVEEVEEEEEAPAPKKSGYKPGDRCTFDGVEYEYVKGDPEDETSWRVVPKEVKPPFMKKSAPKTTPAPAKKSTVKGLLEDNEALSEESPFDNEDIPI